MKIPAFKPKRVFLEDLDIPCLFAKVKNSELPKVATRHIAKYKKDPVCEIWVRTSNPKELIGWPKEMLEQLLEKEGLPAALEEGMRDYETNKAWPGYFKEDEQNYGEIKQHGIVPHLTLHTIVVDEIRRTMILACHTEWDIHLSEHGTALCFQDGAWRFQLGDYLSDYTGEVDEEGRESRWELARPPGEATPDTVTDISLIFGTWEFDENESRALLERLNASPRQIKEGREAWWARRYQIAPTFFAECDGAESYFDCDLLSCERRGEKVTIKYKTPKGGQKMTKNLYYHNGLLMDIDGLVLTRTSDQIPRRKGSCLAETWRMLKVSLGFTASSK